MRRASRGASRLVLARARPAPASPPLDSPTRGSFRGRQAKKRLILFVAGSRLEKSTDPFFFFSACAFADAPADLRLPFAFPSNAAAVETSVNQIGFTTPPSTGAAPSWDAIVEVGGSQQFVSEGRYYECHSLKGVEPGAKIAFERVLATLDGDEPTFGMPYVKGARVEATVLENFKDKKLIVFKYRRKKHYKRKNGHRQAMTRFLVTKVVKP